MKNFMNGWLEWIKEYCNWCKSLYKNKYFWATTIALELVLLIPYGIYRLVERIRLAKKRKEEERIYEYHTGTN